MGLHAAHSLEHDGVRVELVHRDLKPSNLLLSTDGTTRIADFGLARAVGITEATQGALRGTLAYMSPEQARGDRIDHRSDLFSLGLIVSEMIVGERLFSQYSPVMFMLQVQQIDEHIDELLLPIEEICPQLLPIIRLLLKCDPLARYSTARAVLEDLKLVTRLPGADLLSLFQDEAVVAVPRATPEASISEEEEETEVFAHMAFAQVIPTEELVGRSQLIQRLIQMNDSLVSFVTIKGFAGVGKSALLGALLNKLQSRRGRVSFVDLHGQKDLERCSRTISFALELPVRGPGDWISGEELGETLASFGRCTLALDGVDNAVDVLAKQIPIWIRQAPQLQIIVTS